MDDVKGALPLLLTLSLAACGSQVKADRPADPSPAGKNGPPAAWLETNAGSHWLGFSSSCWRNGSTGVCADSGVAVCGGPGIPALLLHPGETVRAHLGYTPDEASLDTASASLAGRVVEWRVAKPGPFTLFTRGERGDASYVGCAVFNRRSLPALQKCSREPSMPGQRCGPLP